mgnify:CR=1 FL=1
MLINYIDTYGASQGNTVMMSDQNEAWIVEIYSGHHYCAMRMPDEFLCANDAVALLSCQGHVKGSAFQAVAEDIHYSKNTVTALGIRMAERTFRYSDNLYRKLTTALIHNTGLGRTPVTFLPDVPLRQIAESKGYKRGESRASAPSSRSGSAGTVVPGRQCAMGVAMSTATWTTRATT